ncbi:alpha/beta hydrolase [Sedimentibacter hydroxybenzoicus DSM 7310]|uniref:Alpha/beta hydrolase n=1 Tax=Sedimentibacter hydroxybenzoicus DSM 7310 TaxID=1123245 RepID=A0A974BGU7_SEDHY|nr:alpha/beta hydrolase [Sedimentibacter hydroxybenzoicus]NYB72838.1 alpha/beta hydrolase [Sedimentibacter hydroxybenzoicus DSM 7310]
MKKAFNSESGKTAVTSYYNMLLEHLTIPYERINVHTRYGNTFALSAGDTQKPTVILLHGSSMSSAMWLDDIMAFAPHYHVIAPDIPGEPGQSDENQLPLDSNDYAEWLLDVLNVLNIKDTYLVGNSLGGWLALRFSTLYPERVKKLVLLAPAGIGSQNPAFGLLAMELLPKGESGINELLIQLNGGMPIPEIRLNYQKLIMSVFNVRQEVIPVLSDEELKRLSMPCLIFVGNNDVILKSDETAARALKKIPQCQVVELPEKGHSLVGMSEEILIFIRDIS